MYTVIWREKNYIFLFKNVIQRARWSLMGIEPTMSTSQFRHQPLDHAGPYGLVLLYMQNVHVNKHGP
jgi:hypothetical protein